MADLKGSRTHENLRRAFAMESQSTRRFFWFAESADVEGLPEIAGNFRDTAQGEIGHAHGLLELLKKAGDPVSDLPIGTTEENLRSALATEATEAPTYEEFARIAREEELVEIAEWFETLARAERSHVNRFQRLLAALDQP